ncbi:hypothetical protein B0T18DRAFT_366512 [Schizothecium vesticola]|uniref:FHA domain-containing protein n=1 Tax=Schizothecium vesticola TaxID=314040 RepID=A0AA40F3M3_9PEZI|nr:hypothetical protein B0T18DRAFT_366512 [Schizothecium vesticola]
MWLLESDYFEGKQLWLRPGSTYLFGRSPSDSGQPALTDTTISRKHITLRVDNVPEGGGRNLQSRSRITLEDLNSKKGTQLNGVQIRGQSKVLSGDENVIKLGTCSKVLTIRWHPVVLSFSFTSKELRADPWETLRESLEQLDIKYSSEYEALTSHVVSKKRNTSKGLQALINGKYIVTDTFISAIVDAATPSADPEEGTLSPLERDYTGNWPNPIDHLPPRGEEPSDRPADAYAPNERRQDVFEGYTFVFYEQKQYDNLFPAITHGKGKALFKEVSPGKTDIDDFVRYVKEVAGEKGMGSFDDGSEGKGVVVVRYVPAKGGDYEWFAQFLTTFAQRLDHRPIDQREFLEAILTCDASMLRRPLQEDTEPSRQASGAQENAVPEPDTRMDVDEPEPQPQAAAQEPAEVQDIAPPPARTRARRGAPIRFKGFDLDSDDESKPEISQLVEDAAPESVPEAAAASQGSLFVSQRQESVDPADLDDDQPRNTRRPQRKRPLSPLPDHDESAFLDGIAPTAAAAKRRRIGSGQTPVAPEPPKEDKMAVDPPTPKKKAPAPRGRGKKPTEADDILEAARQFRDEVDARAEAEKKALAIADAAEVDFAQVRANHIIEECAVHFPKDTQNSDARDQEGGAASRWDPRWNGRKNFKRFRKQGEAGGRAAPRIIVELEEVKPKEYGIGDDYWLEDESSRRRKESQRETQSQAQRQPQPQPVEVEKARASALRRTVIAVDSSDEDDDEDDEDTMDVVDPSPPLSRSKTAKSAEKESSRRSQQLLQTQSQSQTTSSSRASTRGSKRPAPPEPVNTRAAKKARAAPAREEESAEDDSDDELKFRFGRRR